MTMNESSNQNDIAPFDRLVDGELSMLERQQLLASLDDRPESWRNCALAFLESQTLNEQFRAGFAEPATALGAVPLSVVKSSPPYKPARWGRCLAIAASLLLAFSVGKFANRPSAKISPSPETLAIGAPKPQEFLRPEDKFPVASNRDFVTLLVRDTSGQGRRLQVPLMEVEALNEQFSANLSPALRERFRERGYDIHRRRRFAPLFFEQDNQLVPMVVPVDDAYVTLRDSPVF